MKIGYYIIAYAVILGKTYLYGFKRIASCDEIAIRKVKISFEKWLRKHLNNEIEETENFEIFTTIKSKKYL